MALRRRFIVAPLIAATLIAAATAFIAAPTRVASAYVAKTLCSEIFLVGRNEAAVRASEFSNISPALGVVRATVETDKRAVSASLFGLGFARATFRDHHGCTLEAGGAPAPVAKLEAPPPAAAWPQRGADAAFDRAALDAAIDAAMADPVARTRALLVIVDGKIAAERYAPGFDESTLFLSWSMAKSVTATLTGAAVAHGYLKVADRAPETEWARDARKARITWNDLLRMQSGLAFSEVYANPHSDASHMLFAAREAGLYAARKPAAHEPGAVFAYSSGSTNILMRALKDTLSANGEDLALFARKALFEPIGATSFVMEADSGGAPIGSSYMYATARDWARMGQLYLDDGVAFGRRILPDGWVAAARRAAPAADNRYGLQIWLNGDGAKGRARDYPGLPEEMFYFSGHEGQYVFIIPDKRMIVVRTGTTRGADPDKIVGPTLAALYNAVRTPAP